ncbi:TraY domain-containing protein [Methylobacterium organophilum]|uniref:TraY domain-containing protein n=1 Tax=Methylobacterium organophilum TaxID=410 RepID=UPI001EE21895|nr:TraY domain-containing protein [Methylobacterium organophilum]
MSGTEGGSPAKRYTLTSRLTHETETALREAARLSGRSISQEAELRLERSLAEDQSERDRTKENLVAKALMGDDDTEELLRTIAAAIGAAMAYTGNHWKTDIYTRAAVQSAINSVRAKHFGLHRLGMSASEINHDQLERAINTGALFGKVLVAARLDPDVASWISEMSTRAQSQAALEAEASDFAKASPQKQSAILRDLYGVDAA